MQPRHTAVLALIAALLGAFIYFYEIRGGAERTAAEAKRNQLWPEIEADQITSLSVTTVHGVQVDLVREGEGEGAGARWQITSPIDFPASSSAVDAMLAGLAELSSEKRVQGDDLAAFGLGPDAASISFVANGAPRTVRLGGSAPVGGERYVLLDDASDIVLVPANALVAFGKTLDELRDTRVWPFETAAVQRARFAWVDGAVELERRSDGWWLIDPVEERADRLRVDGLLSDLAYLRADGFPEDDVAPSAFDAPFFAAELSGAGATLVDVDLVAAAPTAGAEPRIVIRGREGALFEVAAERADDWPRRVADYRDKTLSRFAIDAARSFEITLADAEGPEPVRIQGELVGGRWVTSPEPMSAAAASGVVTTLSSLDGIDVVADRLGPAEQASLGIAPPRIALRVWGEGSSGATAPLLADVVLGRTRPGIGTYAAQAGGDAILLIDEATAGLLPTSLTAFRGAFLEGAQGDDRPELDRLGAPEPSFPVDDVEGVVEPQL